jgi:diguanylate cyclase (GGDEF)-like protein
MPTLPRAPGAARRPAPGPGVAAAVLAGPAACALAIAVLARGGAGPALAVGMLLPGLLALGAGLPLLRLGLLRVPRPRSLWLLGAALTIWGAGQVGVALEVVGGGTPGFPTTGDVLSLVAAPLAVAGVIAIPRPAPGPHPGLRLGLDAGLLGTALALPAWHFGFASVMDGAPTRPDHIAAVVVIVVDIVLFCVGTLAYLQDLDADLLLVALGVACYCVGDLARTYARLHGDAWLWQAAALWCFAWPLIGLGLWRYRVSTPAEGRVDPDARVVLVATVASLGLLLFSLGFMVAQPRTDRVCLGLVIVAVCLLSARELLNARFRGQLLGQLRAEATEDPLTGLANRRVLASRLRALPRGEPWCLLTLDLDGFKDVNDMLGHSTGDQLLASVARRLVEASPPEALVSRIGGDEFAVLLPGDVRAGSGVGERIVTAVRRSAGDVEGVRRVEVSASVGIAAVQAGPGPGELADLLLAEGGPVPVVDRLGALSASGAALRLAKAAGRNRVEVYDATMARMRQRRLTVEERLRRAVEDESVTVLFQPIVDLRRGTVAGAEALARWTDPELGVVEPGEFIPVAEQTGLVVALGERVLDATLRAAGEHGLFERGLRVSCNVSPVQLRVPGFHRVVQEALTAHGVERDRIVLEVTEQVLVEEGQAARTLHRLAEEGMVIAIDDFGTGYSALGYLHRLPVQILKIDRSLTVSLVGEPRSQAITRAVLDLSHTVGVSVVVEGVETDQVADLIRRMGVGYGQGMFYGEAMPAERLAELADRLGAAPRLA